MADADLEHVDCPLCGPAASEPLGHVGMHGLPAHVVICTNCGLLRLDPRWTKGRYERFYAEEYDHYHRSPSMNDDKDASLATERATARTAFDRLRIAELLPSGIARLLDIGSGSGGFLHEARTLFPDAKGCAIEASPICVARLREAGIEHVATDVDSGWDQGRESTFDLVYMRHVLEHFLDPVHTLRQVRSVLTDDGLVYIAVPNSLRPRPPITTSFFRAVHTYYFNRETLPTLLGIAGLTPVLLVDGDDYNSAELVVVAHRGAANDTPRASSYKAQREVLIPQIRHEITVKYRLYRWGRSTTRHLGRFARHHLPRLHALVRRRAVRE